MQDPFGGKMNLEKLGRNEVCHCGSGKKYKKCCLDEDNYLRVLKTSYELFKRAALGDENEDAGLIAFHHFFPDLAEKENRAFWANGRGPFKDDPYQLVEFYCADPNCDCNRVVVAVADRQKPERGTLLSVGFAFNRKDPDARPYIYPLNPITKEGREFYPMIQNMLETDVEYVSRLKRHYKLVKEKIKSPDFRLLI